jgi:hypothetical protein
MSNSSNLNSLRFATRQINMYGELFVFMTGLFGELLNILIFTTLNTFQQTTCAFYLIVTSIANISLLIMVLLRIIYDGFDTGLNYTPLLRKFRYLLTQYWGLVSTTSMYLAIINQFLSMTTFKQWNSLQIARRLIAFACVLWLHPSIFSFIYFDSYLNSCIIINTIYTKYYIYFQSPILFDCLPLTIMITFSLLAFFKIRTISSRQIDIVLLSRDRQLTAMTLFHVYLLLLLLYHLLLFLFIH